MVEVENSKEFGIIRVKKYQREKNERAAVRQL